MPMVDAVGLDFDVLSYEEHSRGQGSAAQAVCYIEITTRSRRTLFGAGMHPNIITASLAGGPVGGQPGDRGGRAVGDPGKGPNGHLMGPSDRYEVVSASKAKLPHPSGSGSPVVECGAESAIVPNFVPAWPIDPIDFRAFLQK